ncbi:hypothetical protein F0P96_18855 [Hymenobacter busanensis]|uniref:Uncharacterized protein n=1 Tax=Hymenobacter busanensis TaxID=2607656 RepID=A0A7L4ZT83_9BACT|nr:hypothetical protein [Hymenobacter busanensis]KAA9325829.1 hypothetical protein F0P96_18855 [Hymenobacter busanensis]QHJ06331.1 hypothetical protein GUY19_03070 [Hymenobacter busanensis]
MKHLVVASFAGLCLLLGLPAASYGNHDGPRPINTLPRYGGKAKSKALQKIDQDFIASELRKYRRDAHAASEVSVELGWQHLAQQDPAVSIKRFNQAWLLDSTNCNVYYGFSACLSLQGDAKAAREYFRLAQRRDPKNQGAAKYNERLAELRNKQADVSANILT